MNPGSGEKVDGASIADGVDAALAMGLAPGRTVAGPEPVAEKTMPAHILTMQREKKRKSRCKFTRSLGKEGGKNEKGVLLHGGWLMLEPTQMWPNLPPTIQPSLLPSLPPTLTLPEPTFKKSPNPRGRPVA